LVWAYVGQLAHAAHGADVALPDRHHDLAVVRWVTERIVVLRHGKVVEEGATEAVLYAPQQPCTRLLLASVPRRGWDLDQIRRVRRELEGAQT
jgi:ABC-type glutathione transport system ATPase component